MARLLYIQSSPRGPRSVSNEIARQFADGYATSHPDDTIEVLNLWDAPLPEMNGAMLEAVYRSRSGESHTREQADAWQSVVRTIEQFKTADKCLISVPMWNFSIPYKLKHYIDLLVHQGLTYRWTPNDGFEGLAADRPTMIVYARGGVYSPGSGLEHLDQQSVYLRQVLGFIGITNIQEIFVEPTAGAPDLKHETLAAARETAARLATGF